MQALTTPPSLDDGAPLVERLRLDGLPSVERLCIADLTVTSIPDLDRVAWPCDALLEGVGPDLLSAAGAALPRGTVDVAGGQIALSFNVALVQRPGLTLVVDPGIGTAKERPDRPAWHRRESPVLAILNRLGVDAGDVDLVVNTHLHADHIGGNTVRDSEVWVPAFPRARYVVPEVELAFWQSRAAADPSSSILHGAFADSLRPLLEAGCLDAVRLPAELATDITLEPAPGHSPGMSTVRIASAAGVVRLMSDAIHHPLQFLAPDIGSRFCADADTARRTRLQLLESCADEGTIVLPYHFPAPAFGRVRRAGAGYAYAPLAAEQI